MNHARTPGRGRGVRIIAAMAVAASLAGCLQHVSPGGYIIHGGTITARSHDGTETYVENLPTWDFSTNDKLSPVQKTRWSATNWLPVDALPTMTTPPSPFLPPRPVELYLVTMSGGIPINFLGFNGTDTLPVNPTFCQFYVTTRITHHTEAKPSLAVKHLRPAQCNPATSSLSAALDQFAGRHGLQLDSAEKLAVLDYVSNDLYRFTPGLDYNEDPLHVSYNDVLLADLGVTGNLPPELAGFFDNAGVTLGLIEP